MEHEIESDKTEFIFMDTIRLEDSESDSGVYNLTQGHDEIRLTRKQLRALQLILNVEFPCPPQLSEEDLACCEEFRRTE